MSLFKRSEPDTEVEKSPQPMWSTFAEMQTIWHAMSWLFFHRQYAGLGVVLAEYATKTAFSYLPPSQAAGYSYWLKQVGINVDKIGIASIGGSVLNMTFPGISEKLPMEDIKDILSHALPHSNATAAIEHIVANHNYTENVLTNTLKSLLSKELGSKFTSLPHQLNSISGVLSSLIGRVKSLATPIPQEHQIAGHCKFAHFLHTESGWSRGEIVLPNIMADKALECYKGSHWLDVGLSTLNQMLTSYNKANFPDKQGPPESTIVMWLKEAYKLWADWGSQWTPMLNKIGNAAVGEISQIEQKQLNQGMFIAPIPSTKVSQKATKTSILPR